jgi:hypothetical protein
MLIDDIVVAFVLAELLGQAETQEIPCASGEVGSVLQHRHAGGTAAKPAAVICPGVCFEPVYDLVGVDGVRAL